MTSWRYASAAAALLMTSPVGAQVNEPLPYPIRPIRFIAPTPPGSPPDLVARVIGEKLALAFGHPVIVDNRPGATGTIGIAVMTKSTPDGYTLAAIGMPPLVLASLLLPPPFKTVDLAPVSLVAWNYNVLAVPATSLVKSVAKLIAAAKARPGALKYSSAGNATPAHLASELFKRETNVDIMQVNYKGAAGSVAAMLTGEVDLNIGAVGVLSPHVKSGRLRILATSAPQRIMAYPELPTFAELGYPGVQLRDLQAVATPAGTPRHVISRLHVEIAKATSFADVKARLESLGIEAANASPEQTAKHILSELRIWNKVIRDAGIKLD
jgi:tripartite-type tricarboxylate transporter receptor subunit TctC